MVVGSCLSASWPMVLGANIPTASPTIPSQQRPMLPERLPGAAENTISM
jgi:hypothetical protein